MAISPPKEIGMRFHAAGVVKKREYHTRNTVTRPLYLGMHQNLTQFIPIEQTYQNDMSEHSMLSNQFGTSYFTSRSDSVGVE